MKQDNEWTEEGLVVTKIIKETPEGREAFREKLESLKQHVLDFFIATGSNIDLEKTNLTVYLTKEGTSYSVELRADHELYILEELKKRIK